MPASPASAPAGTDPDLPGALTGWYSTAARELPWRHPDAGGWAVLVSEIMLQQTPVSRVLPVFRAWLERWPTPAAHAAESSGEAVRMWGKLGYPRRALRLHRCAVVIVSGHGGLVPGTVPELEALPGVGAYTARAVAAFAFGARVPVVDTNVRRVVARAVHGRGAAGPPATRRDLADVATLLPEQPDVAARFSAAVMELGALVCTSRGPRCGQCPIRSRCAWRAAGSPTYTGASVRPQRFIGTDRQVRGLLLDVLRGKAGPVRRAALDAVWTDPVQRERALGTLVADGLVDALPDGRFALGTGGPVPSASRRVGGPTRR